MIPIIVKEFKWTQTTDRVSLTIRMKGVKSGRTSLVTSPKYIRIHFPPYIFEVFLWGSVDDSKGLCTIHEENEKIVLDLPKEPNEVKGSHWPTLSSESLTKEEKRLIRENAVEISQKRTEDARKAVLESRQEQRQMTVREQIRLEGEARERVSRIKEAERARATTELLSLQLGNQHSDKKNFSDQPKEGGGESNEDPSCGHTINHQSSGRVGDISGSPKSKVESTSCETRPKELVKTKEIWTNFEEKSLPIRQAGLIQVKFTPRTFPTPARDSTALEEQEWLKKQAEARKRSGFCDEDLRPEERSPEWLLEKARSLMEAGSFEGALSALSSASKLAKGMPEIFVERARVHLALGNLRRAVEDASHGIELLTPKVVGNLRDRVGCFETRGNAFFRMELFSEAILDYSEAIALDPPGNPRIREYLEVARARVDNKDSDSD